MKKIITSLMIFSSVCMFSQNAQVDSQVPPPPCYANGNNGFGGAVGEGHFLTSDPNSIVEFHMSTSGNEMNDILVFYIDTGAPGRNSIDLSVDDSADAHRTAITNSNVSGFGSVITFPPGFEASYAVAVNVDFAGLWSIPVNGPVGDNGLNFVTAINSTLNSNSQISYLISFDWADIGLTSTDTFNFVGVYISGSGYSSDEGYGSGIVSGTEGSDNITFNGYLSFPECNATLGDSTVRSASIAANYFDGQLYVKGMNEIVTIKVYDILGRETYSEQHNSQESESIPIELTKNELQFIVIESSDKMKVLKVMPD
ncbi:hypothetical protein [Winogradskyella ouciana]|uniref:hypothetical protein n=1 Tax=Winogradskyella ouciana TaxID=2608631 RepID=UPI003D2A08C3